LTEYIHFPTQQEIFHALRHHGGWQPVRAQLFETLSKRLARRTYDSAAFVFILMEIVYELEETHGQSLTSALQRCVLALTDDNALAQSAIDSFAEIRGSVEVPATQS
jgi:hypothetical protein